MRTYWILGLTIVIITFEGQLCELEKYGCDEGWSNYADFCYLVVASTAMADQARNSCRDLGSTLSSVWSPDERSFILSLWRFPFDQTGFIWLGLRGTVDGSWGYDDGSSFSVKQAGVGWSVLSGVSGTPVATPQKCVALRNSGTVAFLDCVMEADAYACKKALPKVFVTATLLNHTIPAPSSPLGHAQLFERLFPPVLKSLPASESYLAQSVVSTEVGCAFRCFSLNQCQAFQVSCNASSNCGDFTCVLFSDFTW